MFFYEYELLVHFENHDKSSFERVLDPKRFGLLQAYMKVLQIKSNEL